MENVVVFWAQTSARGLQTKVCAKFSRNERPCGQITGIYCLKKYGVSWANT